MCDMDALSPKLTSQALRECADSVLAGCKGSKVGCTTSGRGGSGEEERAAWWTAGGDTLTSVGGHTADDTDLVFAGSSMAFMAS
jgi:hypothetical protein